MCYGKLPKKLVLIDQTGFICEKVTLKIESNPNIAARDLFETSLPEHEVEALANRIKASLENAYDLKQKEKKDTRAQRREFSRAAYFSYSIKQHRIATFIHSFSQRCSRPSAYCAKSRS